ncbi:unnamed protein product [Natator depressus]|uniref:uncharacterized protein LOC141987596 isoform X2 n=1 Tax=Natator depressus TaxID=27790 RepID=UPI003D3F97FE
MFCADPVFQEEVSENYTIQDMNTFGEDFCKEYSINMKSRHDADIALALNNISKAQEKQQRHYAKRKNSKYGEITFDIGDSVLLLNARKRTRKGVVLEPRYIGPYKITAVEGKRVKLQTILGKRLGTMYSMAHLKPFKEPPTLAAASTSEGKIGTEIAVGDTEPETPTEDFRKVDGTVSHDSTVKNIEVTAMEEEKYVGQDVSNNDLSDADDNFDDMLVEEVEDKQWILKESVEDYCIYCNLVNCEKESEDCTMVKCDSCKRWASIPCITEGTNQDYLTDEKKEYNAKNVHSSLLYQKNKTKNPLYLNASCSKDNARKIFFIYIPDYNKCFLFEKIILGICVPVYNANYKSSKEEANRECFRPKPPSLLIRNHPWTSDRCMGSQVIGNNQG